MSQITTHILDTSIGKPAPGITVVLLSGNKSEWIEIGRSVTNSDGRVADLLPNDTPVAAGEYKLRFETKKYFDARGTTFFYPYIEIIFEIATNEHFHVPLLLAPFGYSTYRGS